MHQIIATKQAPSAIGSYSQAVRSENGLFISGQIAIDPESGQLIQQDIEAETKQVMMNLKAILSAADMEFDQVVKTSIFLTDLADFSTVNAVYASFFTAPYFPARETVQVAQLPRGARVEMSMIASHSAQC